MRMFKRAWNILFHPRLSSYKLEGLLSYLLWEHKLFPECEVKLRRRIINRTRRSFIANKGILSPEQKKRIDDFFAPFLKGRKIPYCSHQFYAEKTGVFSEKFMPVDLYYFCIDRHFNDWHLSSHLDNKCLFPKLFPDMPMPEHVAFRLGRYWLDGSYNTISRSDAYKAISASGPVILKAAVDSSSGKGIQFFDGSTQNLEELDEIVKQFPSDIVIQKVVRQSAALAKIHPSSLNTIRILTFLDSTGHAKAYSAVMRIGRGGSRVDNAGSGGIAAGITPEGRLKDCAYTLQGLKFEHEHPDTHVPFQSVVIPEFANLVDTVTRHHEAFPLFRLLSWDMAYDENDKPLLVELNMCFGGVDIHQLTNGPIFGDDTEAILQEVFLHHK